MKKILTSIILTAVIATSFAQWQQNPQGGPRQYPNNTNRNGNNNQFSALSVSSFSQNQLSVFIDNQQYQGNGNNNTIYLDQLYAGNHNIVIYEWKRNILGRNVQKVVYNANLYLKPGFETSIFIDALGRVTINERQLYNNNGGYNQGGPGNNGNGVGYGYGRKKNKHKKHQRCGNDNNRRGWDDD